jgi:ferredoxin-NADP reductase
MATPQKLRCRIQKITNHGDHVYTVDLVSERPLPRFKPGQFLHLTLDDYDPSGFWPESRVFSIASSPAQRDHLKISYSVKGKYTARMENELHEGRMVWVKLPYGDFVIRDAGNVALLAGGTGITAFTAFLENLMPEHPSMVYLVYGARNRNLLIYRDMIENQTNLIPRLKTFYFIETMQSENKAQPTQLTQQTPLTQLTQQTLITCETIGCLSLEPIWNQLENPYETTYYIAGPPAMIQVLTGNLLKKRISPEMIKVDAWE